MGSSPTGAIAFARLQRRSSVVEHRKTLWSQLRRSRFLHHYPWDRHPACHSAIDKLEAYPTKRNTLDCRYGVHERSLKGEG